VRVRGRNGILALTIAIILLGAGCATTDHVMASWVGHSSDELMTTWGPPDSILQFEDGRRVLEWKTTWKSGRNNYTCRQSFMIGLDDTIERWSSSGCPRYGFRCPNGQNCYPAK
jgi:hypothetical protein